MACDKDIDENLPVIVEVEGVTKQCGKCEGACQCTKTHAYKPVHRSIQYTACCGNLPSNCCCKEKPHGYIPLPAAPCSKKEAIMLCAKTANEFNFPEVGFTADVILPGVILAEGQPLSNDKYGTLHVAMVVDENRGEYKLENRPSSGNDDNLIGKPVFCGTKFFLAGSSVIVSTSSTSTCNYLSSDFHIPSVGEFSPAEVSSFEGFESGANAIIRNTLNPTIAYTYEVVSFSGTNKIILKNIGSESGTPGSTLTALDCDESLWCVEAVDPASICEQATETQTIYHVLGCDKDGNIIKIKGTNKNEALIFDNENPEDCGYKNKIVEQTAVCRQLKSCIQIPTYDRICDTPMFYIETTDDSFILSQLQDALLSEVAHPLLEICGYEFVVLMEESSEGAIKIVPTFLNPDAVIKLDETCSVCIPENCCDQCNPQVDFPVAELSPAPEGTALDGLSYGSGLNLGYVMNIPTTAIPAAGEYRFKVIRREGNTPEFILGAFDGTGTLIAAYDPAGNPISLDPIYNLEDDGYINLEWCNDGRCPVRAKFSESFVSLHPTLPDGFCISYNDYAFFSISNCIWPEDIERTTQFSLTQFYKDASLKTASFVNNLKEGWVTGSPGPQPAQAYSGYAERSMIVDYGDCLTIQMTPHLTVFADAALTAPIQINAAQTFLFETEVL